MRRFEERDRALSVETAGDYLLVRGRPVRPAPARPDPGRARRPRGGAGPGRRLVCIGEYPGIAHFGGLGELEPGQLPGLLEAATPLTAEALDLGAAAQAALRAADPGGLGEVAASRSPNCASSARPSTGSAQYPSTRDGLSLTERRLLAATQQGGEPSARAVFAHGGAGGAAVPGRPVLLPHPGPARRGRCRWSAGPARREVTAATRLRLTAAGARVLRGEADHVALNGVDRWVGGVHLHGPEARWRWDEGTESVTRVTA